eukprot:12892263-Prorocentrum_lima.AAC.1
MERVAARASGSKEAVHGARSKGAWCASLMPSHWKVVSWKLACPYIASTCHGVQCGATNA